MLFAKVLTYALNAYLDAQICEELVAHIRSSGTAFATEQGTARTRAEALIASRGEYNKDPSYLIGLAYTEYYLNGLADILYADLLWNFIISPKRKNLRELFETSTGRFRQQLTTLYQYEEIVKQRSTLATYWPQVIVNPWHWIKQFSMERCAHDRPLDPQELRRACLAVQRLNSEDNRQLAAILISDNQSDDPKIIELRLLSHEVMDAKKFLRDAASTQRAAAGWDTLFSGLLHLK